MDKLLAYSDDSSEDQLKDTKPKDQKQDNATSVDPKAAQNNEEFQDLNDLINEEGLGIDHDLDISDLQKAQMNRKKNKFYTSNEVSTRKNHTSGHVEEYHLSSAKFDEQFYTFENFGHAQDPTINRGGGTVNAEGYRKVDYQKDAHGPKSKTTIDYKKELRKKRKREGEAGQEDFLGPWAFYQGEEDFREQKVIKTELQKKTEETHENRRQEKLEEKQREEALEYQQKVESEEEEEKEVEEKPAVRSYSILHLKNKGEEGKSFLAPPSGIETGSHECFIPKKWTHTYSGHSKGVQCIKFFPKYGHYLFSASHDGRVKLWDVMTHKKCVRTYIGHTESVRDISLTNNGRHFISAGYDKYVQHWDTESGKVIHSYNIKSIPFCCTFHPSGDQQNIFLVGSQNKKILQFDSRTAQGVQKYEEHLGSINTVTFVEDYKRFVSTADDKKIFVWEFGIPIVVKHISEPDMHAIPSATLHPNRKYFAGQSMDNKVVIYDCKGSFKINRKKKFAGHKNAGYACGLSFSPNGQFLSSGDSDGKLWFWDWKSGRNYRTIKAHDKVCIDVAWHPIDPSKVATCSWDGTIKIWD
ncbi:unnamed protein product [Moneuplotes crassus]|uniref:Pre-mRNA-processing factor 17 n=1 Tax=Euplotes crassus TaxID=5936 RepID=A0AAD1U8A6_EUPCR|nr:unnamed protein product [Moneuplotes crassus]